MVDLYPTLLKNIKTPAFGINPSSIVFKKQGEVVVKSKKLLVTYDGEKYEPVDCQSVTMVLEGDTIILDIVLIKTEEQVKDVPRAEAVIPASETATFMLQGDDLEAFSRLSDFSKKENQTQKTENDELEAHTLESGTFDIQDLTSVQNAILDIIARERQFINKGYKVFKTNTPRFDYENSSNFKLIESVVLIKPATEVVEENK